MAYMKQGEFEAQKDAVRQRLSKFTAKAFQMLPKLDRPRILDVGCGSGIPTMKLAEWTNGQITALDIDQKAMDRLKRKLTETALSGRVEIIECSMFDMDFPKESFDIIWAEGSIHVAGFESGLRNWGELLKTGGFLAVHDEKGDISEKLGHISNCGYELLGYFNLDEETWRNEYYAPLQKLIDDTRTGCADHPNALAFLEKEQEEINVFKKNPERCCSVFFIMRKK